MKKRKENDTINYFISSGKDAHNFAINNINLMAKPRDCNNSYTLDYILATTFESMNKRLIQRKCIQSDKNIIQLVKNNKNQQPMILYTYINTDTYNLCLQIANKEKDKRLIPSSTDLYYKNCFLNTSLIEPRHKKQINELALRIFVPYNSTGIYYTGKLNPNFSYQTFIYNAKLSIINIDKKYIDVILT